MQRADPDLGTSLHEGDGPRPYTVSSLLGRFPEGRLDIGATYTLRLTALRAAWPGHLLAAARKADCWRPARSCSSTTGRSVLRPRRASGSAALAGTSTYADLAAAHLVPTEPPPRQITLSFTSPTAFKSHERTMPLPLPDLVFGSLLTAGTPWQRGFPR